MSRTSWLIAAAMSLALPCAVQAQAVQSDAQNQPFSIVGQVTADEESAERVGLDDLSIGFASGSPGTVVWIGVVSAQGEDGDGFRGKEMLDQIDGYTPNLRAVGSSEVVAKLRQAPVGSRITVQGIVDGGARTYLLESVQVIVPGSK